MDAKIGAKNREMKKQIPEVMAVRPVLPPSAIPVADSTNAVHGEVPMSDPREIHVASTQYAMVEFSKSWVFGFVTPENLAIEYSVPWCTKTNSFDQQEFIQEVDLIPMGIQNDESTYGGIHQVHVKERDQRKPDFALAIVIVDDVSNILEATEIDDLLEEIKVGVAGLGVWEECDGGVAWPGADGDCENTQDDGTLDAVHHHQHGYESAKEDSEPHCTLLHNMRDTDVWMIRISICEDTDIIISPHTQCDRWRWRTLTFRFTSTQSDQVVVVSTNDTEPTGRLQADESDKETDSYRGEITKFSISNAPLTRENSGPEKKMWREEKINRSSPAPVASARDLGITRASH